MKEVVFSVSGKGVYGRMKFESGTHRVQRVPETEASGRIHTSAATVAVLPEAVALEGPVPLDEVPAVHLEVAVAHGAQAPDHDARHGGDLEHHECPRGRDQHDYHG